MNLEINSFQETLRSYLEFVMCLIKASPLAKLHNNVVDEED